VRDARRRRRHPVRLGGDLGSGLAAEQQQALLRVAASGAEGRGSRVDSCGAVAQPRLNPTGTRDLDRGERVYDVDVADRGTGPVGLDRDRRSVRHDRLAVVVVVVDLDDQPVARLEADPGPGGEHPRQLTRRPARDQAGLTDEVGEPLRR